MVLLKCKHAGIYSGMTKMSASSCPPCFYDAMTYNNTAQMEIKLMLLASSSPPVRNWRLEAKQWIQPPHLLLLLLLLLLYLLLLHEGVVSNGLLQVSNFEQAGKKKPTASVLFPFGQCYYMTLHHRSKAGRRKQTFLSFPIIFRHACISTEPLIMLCR